jgi:hypothetical protein
VRRRISILCLLIIIVISACGQKSDLSCESLLAKTSYENVNTTIKLSTPPHANSFKYDDLLFVVVDNNSQTEIEVTPDQDLKIFWWKDDSWRAVKNGMDYLSAIDRLSPETDDDPGGTVYSIAFSTPTQDDSARFCITLEGIDDPDGARAKVAAYTEVVLGP